MTDSSQTVILHLSDLCQDKPERPGWSLTFGATCADAAAVCLEEQGHYSSVTLQIDGIRPCEIEKCRT